MTNFAILGCGAIAAFHVDAIKSLPSAGLIGAADFDPTRAQAFAQRYGLQAYADFEQLLGDARVDTVCICTPSGLHAQQAIAALQAGKHVVVEKPMALNTADADAVIAACEKSGRQLTVISQLRFSEDIGRLRGLMEQKAFGRLVFCNLSMKYWRDPSYYASSPWRGTKRFDGGGALMNQGIHGVDLLQYLAGPATVIGARAKTRLHEIEVEDTAAALLEFENGAVGTVEASTCARPGFERKLEIIGTDGHAILRENRLEKLMIGGETLIDGLDDGEIPTTSGDPLAMSSHLHARQLAEFIDAVENGRRPLVDAYEGRKAIKLIEDIYQF